jgi:hypothetical protein
MTSVILTGYCNHTRTQNEYGRPNVPQPAGPTQAEKDEGHKEENSEHSKPSAIVLWTEDAEVSVLAMTP